MARGRVAVAIELSVSERRELNELARRRQTKSADDILASIKRFCLANIRIAEHQQRITQTSALGH
jgi:hypothetical protein